MLKRLKSVLKSQILQLTFKSAVLSILLYFSANSLFFALLFGTLAVIFYFSPILFWKEYLRSFFIISVLSFIFVDGGKFLGLKWPFLISLAFGALFFLIFGIKNFIFTNRREIYYFLNNALFFLIFLVFLGFSSLESHVFKYFLVFLIIFLGIFILFKEFLNQHKDYCEQNACLFLPRSNLLAVGLAFLTVQFLWVISLLPLGFFNASAFVLVMILAVKDLLVDYIDGVLRRESILKNVTIILVFGLIIFAVSKWQI